MLVTLFTTLLPRYPARVALRTIEEETIELNAALLDRFCERGIAESETLLVYIPTELAGDFESRHERSTY